MNKKEILAALFCTAIFFQTTTISLATSTVSVKPTSSKIEPTVEPTITPAILVAPKVEYTLPYPGVLSDHPLYALKNLRDKIMDFLIRDPLKRMEFNLLMSDKRLNMGIMLMDQKKSDAALKIVTEGEQFMSRVFDEGKKAQTQGRVIREDIIKKLANSLAKHKEVITGLLDKGPENVKQGYQKLLEQITVNQDIIPSLSK